MGDCLHLLSSDCKSIVYHVYHVYHRRPCLPMSHALGLLPTTAPVDDLYRTTASSLIHTLPADALCLKQAKLVPQLRFQEKMLASHTFPSEVSAPVQFWQRGALQLLEQLKLPRQARRCPHLLGKTREENGIESRPWSMSSPCFDLHMARALDRSSANIPGSSGSGAGLCAACVRLPHCKLSGFSKVLGFTAGVKAFAAAPRCTLHPLAHMLAATLHTPPDGASEFLLFSPQEALSLEPNRWEFNSAQLATSCNSTEM